MLGLPEGVRILTDPGVAYPSQHSNRNAAERPAISGTPRVGETLTASPNEISDTDGMGEAVLAYQWSGDGGSGPAEIPGAAGSSLALTEDQEGKSISVTVSFTDDACNPESLTSEPTEAVKPKPNSPAIGQLTISGTVQVGETIRAEMSAIVDDDGLSNVVFTYQWLADDVEITGATSSTYTPVDTDEGKTIKVIVTFTDDNDNEEALTSEATATVMAAVTPLTAAFQEAPDSHDGSNPFTFSIAFSEDIGINYTTLRDHSLEVDNGSVTQAKRVGGSNKLWEITVDPDSDADVTIVLPVTDACESEGAICTRAEAGTLRALSNRSDLTVYGPAAAANSPATGATTISGTPQVGQTLTASTSGIADADGLTNVSFSYQWLAGDLDINGATGGSYTLVANDEGKTIKVRVTFADDGNNEETLTSEATTAVTAVTAVAKPNSPATGLPTISGTVQVGETLTAETSGIDDADGLDNVSYSYQWLANGADIAGATSSSYTLVDADKGKAIKVKVSFRDDKNNPETLTSAATAAVEPRPNSPATGAPTISGTAQVGETLTVDTSDIADSDGMSGAVFSYQWLANGADVAGATSDTYTPVADDVGKAIKVKVSFRDDKNNPETLTSEATAVVAAAAVESSIWASTLTVERWGTSNDRLFGFDAVVERGELDPPGFSHDGVEYRVEYLILQNGGTNSQNATRLHFKTVTDLAAGNYILYLDGTPFPFEASGTEDTFIFSEPGLKLRNGGEVEVSLTLAD